MWKKDEGATEHSSPSPQPDPLQPTTRSGGGSAMATIGSSITIRGEVSGDEDLLIEGHVDGSVDLGQHAVTVGSAGQVKAGITGRVVTVEGTVHGDLQADEMVVLRTSAHVQGDITAPRVVLEDGATFRGAVDMSGQAGGKSRPRATNGRAVPTRTGSSASGSGDATASTSSGKSTNAGDGGSPSPEARADAEA